MPPATAVLGALLSLVLIQRLTELRRAERNAASALGDGAVEHGRAHYPAFFVLHAGWLIGWVVEAWLGGPALSRFWWGWGSVFLVAELLRYWAIFTFGPRWNTRILVLPGLSRIRSGPYRLLRHPNYLAVALELCAVPMIFGAWITAAVVGVLNAALLLGVRIPAEERALAAALGDRRDLA